ncbi:MAG: AAA family ATPase [Deltaproteobacteria bacterium]|nr:AAA family ATPase [Deltaproteobacteria bacterium]
MKVLAVYNSKGGVGKTAAAVNLSYLAAQEGARTLVWDLDPQGAATYYFRVKPKVKGGTRKLLKKNADLAARIRGTDFPQLDLLPSDFSYRHMDIVLDEAKKPSRRLARLLEPLAGEYDYVLLDCPPNVSLLSEAVLGASDALLVPIIPTTLSLRTLDQILAFRSDNGFDRVAVLPFFSLVDRRKKLHRQILEALPADRPELLTTRIPYASDVERMGVERQPLACYAARSASTRAYAALWREIQGRLDRGDR